MAKRQAVFPQRIYVKLEHDDSSSNSAYYLVADKSVDSMDDGDKVGVYSLVTTGTMQVTKTLEKVADYQR